MDRRYSEALWHLFRKTHRKAYSFKEKRAVFLRREGNARDFPSLWTGPGDVKAYESHSGRSAWVHSPWKENGRWYPGFEYKGVGENGEGIRRFAGTAWGGVYRKEALAEHRFAKTAFDGGVFCQRPIAVYAYGRFYGKDLGVVVRTFISPIRLSDFLFKRRCFNEYLALRGETEKDYCQSLSATLGKNVRRLFDIGLYHGSMEMNNITSEGELADFEPTYGGTWEGLRRTKAARFRYAALRRVLGTGKRFFPRYRAGFESGFAAAFFGKDLKLTGSDAAKQIAERYCGEKIEVGAKRKPDRRLMKARKIIEKLKKQTKDRKRLRILEHVLKCLDG